MHIVVCRVVHNYLRLLRSSFQTLPVAYQILQPSSYFHLDSFKAQAYIFFRKLIYKISLYLFIYEFYWK